MNDGTLNPVYKESGLTFSTALECLKIGRRVQRVGWNGKGMSLALVAKGDYIVCHEPGSKFATECKELLPWIGMFTADKNFVPWLASQTDILAEDWQVVA